MSDSFNLSTSPNFATLLTATTSAYQTQEKSSPTPKNNNRLPSNDLLLSNGTTLTQDPVNYPSSNYQNAIATPTYSGEQNRFDEIQKIIAAELDNVNANFPQSDDKDEDSAKAKKKKVHRFKGVFKCGKKWKAQIQAHGVQHYLGLFDTEEAAARAYDNHARMILGAIKAKTNFPYDPTETPLQPIMPVQKVKADPDSPRNDKNGHAKRSYVGMKVRKRSVNEMLDGNDRSSQSHSSPTGSPTSGYSNPHSSHYTSSGQMTSPSRLKSSHGSTIVHLPLPMAQSTFIMNNIPGGYNPVLNSVRYVSNSAFEPTQPSNNDSDIDWSKHPAYTPLEITGHEEDQHMLPTHNLPDWRDQIYYWTGKVEYNEALQCLLWKGKWIGSFTGKPTTEEFEASESKFCYNSVPIDKAKVLSANGNTQVLRPVSGFYKGSYTMDPGDEEEYCDKEFLLDFEDAGKLHNYNVYGKGDSDFGAFILQGTFDGQSRVLDLCRQYIVESDPRCSMTLSQLKLNLKRNPICSSSIIL